MSVGSCSSLISSNLDHKLQTLRALGNPVHKEQYLRSFPAGKTRHTRRTPEEIKITPRNFLDSIIAAFPFHDRCPRDASDFRENTISRAGNGPRTEVREKDCERSNSFDSRLSSSNYEPRDEEPCDQGAKEGWIAYAFVICGYMGDTGATRETEREKRNGSRRGRARENGSGKEEGRFAERSRRETQCARRREEENKPIQRYRIQAKADKPTTLERALL